MTHVVLNTRFVCVFSESEDEVEEIEERVPSPDIAQEESAPFYDPTPWYNSQAYLPML